MTRSVKMMITCSVNAFTCAFLNTPTAQNLRGSTSFLSASLPTNPVCLFSCTVFQAQSYVLLVELRGGKKTGPRESGVNQTYLAELVQGQFEGLETESFYCPMARVSPGHGLWVRDWGTERLVSSKFVFCWFWSPEVFRFN